MNKEFKIEEVFKLNQNEYMLIDIREKHDFDIEPFIGAINIPKSKIIRMNLDCFNNRKVIISCYIGISSKIIVKYLQDNNIDAYNLIGGYEAYKSIINNK